MLIDVDDSILVSVLLLVELDESVLLNNGVFVLLGIGVDALEDDDSVLELVLGETELLELSEADAPVVLVELDRSEVLENDDLLVAVSVEMSELDIEEPDELVEIPELVEPDGFVLDENRLVLDDDNVVLGLA